MRRSVLLLDDEVHIRRDLGGYLEHMGYGVHRASSIDEAIKIILCETIDYAIVDLKIDYAAEFGGVQIINFIKKRQPRSKVVVLSGYDLDDSIRSHLEVELDGYIPKGGPENYLLAALAKLDCLQKQHPAKICFVIMPISATKSCRADQWSEIYNRLFKPAIERSGYDYQCKISEAFHGSIIADILDQLNRADVVLADLTDMNPNVFYELGVRHALRDSTILVAQRLDDIPFDLRHHAIQGYDWTTEGGRKKFMDRIRTILDIFEKTPDRALSPVRKYLTIGG